MAIDINTISINLNGLNDWSDYKDVLQELAQEITNYRLIYKGTLSTKEKDRLRKDAREIRLLAQRIEEELTDRKLEDLQSELTQLESAIERADSFLTDVENAKDAINAVAKVIEIAGIVLKPFA